MKKRVPGNVFAPKALSAARRRDMAMASRLPGSPYGIDRKDYSAFWVRVAQSRLSQSGSAGASAASFQ